MIYKYIFQSPVKFDIETNNEFQEVSYSDIESKISVEQLNKFIKQHTKNFMDLLNHEGLISVKFQIISGNTLQITVNFDHPLIKKEFYSLYTDLQAQLIDGIGRNINNISIIEFDDTNQNDKNDVKELQTIKKKIYCSLWQEKNWKLVFITNHFKDQQQQYNW